MFEKLEKLAYLDLSKKSGLRLGLRLIRILVLLNKLKVCNVHELIKEYRREFKENLSFISALNYLSLLAKAELIRFEERKDMFSKNKRYLIRFTA